MTVAVVMMNKKYVCRAENNFVTFRNGRNVTEHEEKNHDADYVEDVCIVLYRDLKKRICGVFFSSSSVRRKSGRKKR